MKCAFDKDRDCNNECAAFMEIDTLREGTWEWDTCLNEYVTKWTKLYKGTLCNRLGHMIGKRTLIAENNKKVE